MKRFSVRGIVFLGLLVASGCAGTTTGGGTASGSASLAELEAIRVARTDSMRARFSAADVLFATGMIGHHAQALEMAGHAPNNGASGPVRILAARIFNSQVDEIAILQRWLRDRGQPVPEPTMPGMHAEHAAGHGAAMPGMLTPEQLAELAAARGPEFDRLFLTYMIQHHRGAVTMVDQLFATDGALQGDEMFKLASDIQVDQRTEIARMQTMLSRM